MCTNLPFFASVSILIVLAQQSQPSAASSSNNVLLDSLRTKRQASCNRLEFRCNNGDCVPSYSVCDGPRDCSDGSDETRATCRAQSLRCPLLAFECAYGACIDREKRCDGSSDCADGSDEKDCKTRPAVGNCGSKFQCANNQCIDQYDICDGINNCGDSSDETAALCKDLKCLTSSFQCEYGACLDRSVKCNGVVDCVDGSDERGCPNSSNNSPPPVTRPTESPGGVCRLPQHPRNGVYKSNQCGAGDSRVACRNTPGTMVPNDWVLKYSCNTNYKLSSDIDISVCDNGVWKNPLDCVKLCPPLRSLSVDVRCFLNGREETCDQPMKPNTTAKATCKQHYKALYNPEYSSLLCQDNGEWSYPLFYCSPDCGVSITNTNLVTLIHNGATTRQGEFPWLTALYLRGAEDRWEQKCAGTLISPHIVLTAAHCLVLTESTVTPQNIKVGLGKYHRDFYKNENYSMIADVREIVTPRFYSGGASFYAVDIGLLDLVVSVQVTAYIMPACVDWSNMYPINSGTVGHVAGWGTTENQKASETILSAQLNYTDNASCIKSVRPVYQRLITHDKFCAISINGSQVDKGDSGGGLTVVRNGLHFVIGIVSTKITEEISFSLFTDISNAEHHTWLEEHRTRLNRFHVES